jgi:hypothetical protein
MSGAKHITDTAATKAKTDLVTAYNDLGIPAPTILSSPDLAGRVLLPGTYATSAGTFANSGKLTLDAQGDPNKVFIFQTASTLVTSTDSTMVLANGAQACNVYWRVGSSATIGVSSTLIGHVYALTSITATTSATIYGQLLARNGAVTLDRNTIVNNACATAAVTTTTTRATGATTTTARATPTRFHLADHGLEDCAKLCVRIALRNFQLQEWLPRKRGPCYTLLRRCVQHARAFPVIT